MTHWPSREECLQQVAASHECIWRLRPCTRAGARRLCGQPGCKWLAVEGSFRFLVARPSEDLSPGGAANPPGPPRSHRGGQALEIRAEGLLGEAAIERGGVAAAGLVPYPGLA
eukprot:10806520-Alexandrium_andersonii.AAC.2